MRQGTDFLPPDPALTADDWLAHLADLAEESGYLEPLGSQHWAHFADEGADLLVSFDTLADFTARPVGDLPPLQAMARDRGWSHLSVIARGPTWYRDRRVWGYVDRLIDEGFFEDFDRVLFCGSGMGAYAACAFSVAAPGSGVLALRPVATLDPQVAGWDRRELAARRHDFRSRFGYAPAMIAGQSRVWLVYDPAVTEDAMHAALFQDRVVTRLPCRHLGSDPAEHLAAMGQIAPLVEAAMDSRLTPALWARIWRQRRDHAPWLRNMARALAQAPHRRREKLFLQAALQCSPELKQLRRRLEQISAP